MPDEPSVEVNAARSPEQPEPAGDRAGSPWGPWTWLIGAAALGVRVGVVLSTQVVLQNDSADYQRLGASLAAGHGFGVSHFAPGGGPTALRPPLYPLFLGALYRLVGTHVTAARLAGAVLGAVTVVLVVATAWSLWGRAVAMTAGVVAALLPSLVLASTSVMSEAIAVPLELSAMALALAYRRRPHVGRALATGAVLGAVVLTRPSLAVLVLPIALLLADRRHLRRAVTAVGAVVVAGTLVVAPWVVRDRVVMHAWVPVTTQSGYVLSGTYNATAAADRTFPAAWRPATLDPAMKRVFTADPRAGEVRIDGALESAARRYLGGHPSYLATVAFENTRRLFDLGPLSWTRGATASEYGFPARWGDAEAAGALAVLAAALAGVALRRGRRAPAGWVWAPVVLWVSTVVLQAVPRFRAVIDPFLVQFAAVAAVAALGRLRVGLAAPLRAEGRTPAVGPSVAP